MPAGSSSGSRGSSGSTATTRSQGGSRSRNHDQEVQGADDARAACRLLCIAADVLDQPRRGTQHTHEAQLHTALTPHAQVPSAEAERLASPPVEPAARTTTSAHTHTHAEEEGKSTLAGRLLAWLWGGSGGRDAPPALPSSEGRHPAKPEQQGTADQQPAVPVRPNMHALVPAAAANVGTAAVLLPEPELVEGQEQELAGDAAAAAAASSLMAALVPLVQAHASQLTGELLLQTWRAVAKLVAFAGDGSSGAVAGGGVGVGTAGGGGSPRAAAGGQQWVAAMGAAFAGGELRWVGVPAVDANALRWLQKATEGSVGRHGHRVGR